MARRSKKVKSRPLILRRNQLIGMRFAQHRKVKRLSQREVGNLVGLHRSTVSKWEVTGMLPKIEYLLTLVEKGYCDRKDMAWIIFGGVGLI